MDRLEWTAVVQNMIAHGAPVPDAEINPVIEYLANTLGRTAK
jgi:hypothetical protein